MRRKRAGKPTLLDPDLFKSKLFRFGVTGQMLQQIALGGTMIALPIYLQIVLEYNAMRAGLSIAPLSLSMFAVALVAGRRGREAASGEPDPGWGSCCSRSGWSSLIPIVPRATSGWYLVVPLMIAGSGLGLLVSQLNNYTLAPISEERVSEAAGVNSAGGSFGLSFGLAFAGAIMLATLSVSFTSMAESSTVLSPAEQQQVAKVAGARRRSDEQHPAREATRRPAAEDQGRDHPDQHRGPARSPCRWPCSSRSSPVWSGCSTRSG